MFEMYGRLLRANRRWILIAVLQWLGSAAVAVLLAGAWCVVLAVPLSKGLPADGSPEALAEWSWFLVLRVGVVSPGALAFGAGIAGFYLCRLAHWTLRRKLDRQMAASGFEAKPYAAHGRRYEGRVGDREVWIVVHIAPGKPSMCAPRLMILVTGEVGADVQVESRSIHSPVGQSLFGIPQETAPPDAGLEHLVFRSRDEAWCHGWLAQPGVVEAIERLAEPRPGAVTQPVRLRHDCVSRLVLPVDPAEITPDALAPHIEDLVHVADAAARLPATPRSGGGGKVGLGGNLDLWRKLLPVQRVVAGLAVAICLGTSAVGLLWIVMATVVLMVL